jgi:hypothetical protein
MNYGTNENMDNPSMHFSLFNTLKYIIIVMVFIVFTGCATLGFGNSDDEDGDGIKDSVDKCIAEAEDFDGFEDKDGCPDLDNDNDGILDTHDMCPGVPETKNGIKDDDGCPD